MEVFGNPGPSTALNRERDRQRRSSAPDAIHPSEEQEETRVNEAINGGSVAHPLTEEGVESQVSAEGNVWYAPYGDESRDLPAIIDLVQEELSEPYNVYTFRYFLDDWPQLSFFAYPPPCPPSSSLPLPATGPRPRPIGCIVCKQELHKHTIQRGYIGMLSVSPSWRRRGIAQKLIALAVEAMKANGADEVILETEYDNKPSLGLYERQGFRRSKRLFRFYLNGKDAFRLVLPITKSAD